MIFSGFVYLGAFVLNLVSGILPTGTGFPIEVQQAITTFGGYVQILDTILPIQTLAIVLGIIIATDLAIFGFKTLKWVVSHIPFVGGRG
jgi:hypothetical protein